MTFVMVRAILAASAHDAWAKMRSQKNKKEKYTLVHRAICHVLIGSCKLEALFFFVILLLI